MRWVLRCSVPVFVSISVFSLEAAFASRKSSAWFVDLFRGRPPICRLKRFKLVVLRVR